MATLGLFTHCQCDDDSLGEILPAWSVNPSELDLGEIPITVDTELQLEVCSESSADVRVNGIRLLSARLNDAEDDLQVHIPHPWAQAGEVDDTNTGDERSTPFRLSGQDCELIPVLIRPQVEGALQIELALSAAEYTRPSADLNVVIRASAVNLGLPDIEVAPSSIVFEAVGRGQSPRQSVTIANVGSRELHLDATVWLSDESEDRPYEITRDVRGRTLAPGESTLLEVVLLSERVRDEMLELDPFLERTLVVVSNDPDESEFEIPLSASWVECPTPVIELDSDLSTVFPGGRVRLNGLSSIALEGSAGVASYNWAVPNAPIGFTGILENPETGVVEFEVPSAGFYEVELSLVDQEGRSSCAPARLEFQIQSNDALQIQLLWEHASADLDLHLVRSGGELFNSNDDLYFNNRNPNWNSQDPSANPRLDRDDDSGYGPENAAIEAPRPGDRYEIYVHYWRTQSIIDEAVTTPELNATLNLYLRGEIAAQFQHFFEEDETLWYVGDFIWPEDEDGAIEIVEEGELTSFVRPFG